MLRSSLKIDAARFSTRIQTCLAAKLSCCSWANPDFSLANSISNTTGWLLATLSCCETSWSVIVIRAAYTSLVAKSRTIYFLQQTFSTCNRLFWCETSLYTGGKTCSIDFQPVSQQCCKTSWACGIFALIYFAQMLMKFMLAVYLNKIKRSWHVFILAFQSYNKFNPLNSFCLLFSSLVTELFEIFPWENFQLSRQLLFEH